MEPCQLTRYNLSIVIVCFKQDKNAQAIWTAGWKNGLTRSKSESIDSRIDLE
jgi:hypothetical protein